MARILIVDDEEVVRSLIRTVLKHYGHDVAEAVDGQEAIEMFEREPADLVMVDLIMPKKNGLDTILEMRAKHPETRFVVMTGALPTLLESENMTALIGDLKTLSKPMTPTGLIETVNGVLAAEHLKSTAD